MTRTTPTTNNPAAARRLDSEEAVRLARSLARGDRGEAWPHAEMCRHPDAFAGIGRGFAVAVGPGEWVEEAA